MKARTTKATAATRTKPKAPVKKAMAKRGKTAIAAKTKRQPAARAKA